MMMQMLIPTNNNHDNSNNNDNNNDNNDDKNACGPLLYPFCPNSGPAKSVLRPCFILIIIRPRIFESKFRNHCAKKLVGALRKPTSLM